MEHIASALIPIFALISLGYYFKKINFPSNTFWISADKLTYFILMPSLLIYKLSNASINNQNNFYFILTGVLSIIFIAITVILVNKFFKFKNDSLTSVMQGAIRYNTYVFLALVDALFDANSMVLALLLITFVVPLINVLCIGTFSMYMDKTLFSLKFLVKSILTNPLIIACIIGGFISYIDFDIPIILNNTLEILSNAALPMGLISIGFGLYIREINNSKNEVIVSSILKFILMPLTLGFIGYMFSLNNQMISLLILFGVLPTAPSAYILARQLGGDVKLMSSIISVQTILSILAIALVLEYII